MPKIDFNVPHPFDAAEVRSRLNGFLPRVQEHYKDMLKDLEQSWTDDVLNFSFKAMGLKIAGTLGIQPSQVAVHIELPLAAMIVKGKIEQEIRGGLERLLR